MANFADDTLAMLRPLYPDFDLWTVKRVGAKGYVWCARRKSEQTAVVNADSPEELVEALRQLDTR